MKNRLKQIKYSFEILSVTVYPSVVDGMSCVAFQFGKNEKPALRLLKNGTFIDNIPTRDDYLEGIPKRLQNSSISIHEELLRLAGELRDLYSYESARKQLFSLFE